MRRPVLIPGDPHDASSFGPSGFPPSRTPLSQHGASYEGVGLPVRSPQRRGVRTNRLREGPTSPLHLGTEIAPPVRDGAKSSCPYWPKRACLPGAQHRRQATDETPSRAIGFCVGWPTRKSPAGGSGAQFGIVSSSTGLAPLGVERKAANPPTQHRSADLVAQRAARRKSPAEAGLSVP